MIKCGTAIDARGFKESILFSFILFMICKIVGNMGGGSDSTQIRTSLPGTNEASRVVLRGGGANLLFRIFFLRSFLLLVFF